MYMYELIKRAKQGDKEALTEIIIKKKSKLLRTARTLLTEESDIEDVLQETMITAYIKIHRLKREELFDIWIKRILINECRKFYRRKYKKEIPVEVEKLEQFIATKDKLDEQEEEMDFKLFIKKLNRDEKMILILYYQEGYTTKEISELLEIKEGTIKSKISRAKTKLRKIEEDREVK